MIIKECKGDIMILISPEEFKEQVQTDYRELRGRLNAYYNEHPVESHLKEK